MSWPHAAPPSSSPAMCWRWWKKLCDEIAIIKNGRIQAVGPTASVVGDDSLEEVFLDMVDQDEEVLR